LSTTTQGVVTYGVKIGFDTQDERVRPGMSVSATVITETRQDVLLIPNSAVKTSGDNYYVIMPDETVASGQAVVSAGIVLKTAPRQQAVQVGSSDDSNTEIISGLKEGDLVITKTITSSASSGTQKSSGSSGGATIKRTGGGMPGMPF
jgi:HlyD family secretion protein